MTRPEDPRVAAARAYLHAIRRFWCWLAASFGTAVVVCVVVGVFQPPFMVQLAGFGSIVVVTTVWMTVAAHRGVMLDAVVRLSPAGGWYTHSSPQEWAQSIVEEWEKGK